jgi:Holliday junction resolvase RusA-like endonuclease
VSRREERWTEQDVALVKARQQLATAVKTLPIEAATARTYSFTVPGHAQPGGSKQAFVPVHPKTKEPYRRPNGGIMANVVDANPKVGKWKKHVARVAHQEYAGPIFDGFLRVTFIFFQPRPGDHYTSTGKLSKHGIDTPWPNVKPDVLKLARAAEDALTGLCWIDDAIIVKEVIEKEYGTPARVEITVEELTLPAQHDQVDLFAALEPPAPWETESTAAASQPPIAGRRARAHGAPTQRETSDAGSDHNGDNRTQESAGPAPWEAQDQEEPAKKRERSQGKGNSVTTAE